MAYALLNWNAPISGDPPISYQPWISLDQATWAPTGLPTSDTSTAIHGLTEDTLYYFRVEAINLAGDGPFSDTASVYVAQTAIVSSPPQSSGLLHAQRKFIGGFAFL